MRLNVTAVIATKTDVSFVSSPNPNAYPSGVVGGYTYTKLGQVGGATRLKTLEYTGTGTAGPSNPTTISIGFAPVMVLIDSYATATSVVYPSLFWRKGFDKMG